MAKEEGLGYFSVPGGARGESQKEGPRGLDLTSQASLPSHFYSLLLFYLGLSWRKGATRCHGATRPQGMGFGGWSGSLGRPSMPGLPSPSRSLLVEFVLWPESHLLCPRGMWARMGPLGSLEKR